MKRSRSLFAAAALAVAVASASGCAVFGSPGPSAVSQAQKYQTGHPTYDKFFTTLYDAQRALGTVPDREKKNREKLGSKLGVEGSDAPAFLPKHVEKLGQDLLAKGTAVTLDVRGAEGEDPEDVEARITTAGAAPDATAEAKLRAIEKAAEEAAKLYVICRMAKAGVKQVSSAAPELEKSIDEVFRKEGIAKRSEVEKNMADARQLIPLMLDRAEKFEKKSEKLLEKLREAMSTNKGQFDAPPPPKPEAATEEPPPKPKGGKGDRKGSGGGAPPPPKKSGDFEP